MGAMTSAEGENVQEDSRFFEAFAAAYALSDAGSQKKNYLSPTANAAWHR